MQSGNRDRRSGEDRRSGKDRRRFDDPAYRGIERRGAKITFENRKCQQCISALRDLEVLILECPFPQKDCGYKHYHEMIHYVIYPSSRIQNDSTVVASTSSDIMSPRIILIRPDPILANNQIYYIDVTNSQSG
jgi:hypothetical protein